MFIKAERSFFPNELLVYPLKTVCIIFSQNSNVYSTIQFLGVKFDSKLKWNEHITFICGKFSTAIHAIRRIQKCAGENAARTAYFALFHSIMMYELLVWGTSAQILLKQVIILQIAAVRAIANAKSRQHYGHCLSGLIL